MAESIRSTSSVPEKTGIDTNAAALATPVIAAAYAAGIVYMWLEAAFRLVFTYTPLASSYVLWNGRVGDVAAMWLTISAASLVVFFGLAYWLFKGRSRVGTITIWTIALIISVVVAPLIGEIGTPIGI